jgi:hypothetical protein
MPLSKSFVFNKSSISRGTLFNTSDISLRYVAASDFISRPSAWENLTLSMPLVIESQDLYEISHS